MDELHLLRLHKLADILENFHKERNNLHIPGDGTVEKFEMSLWGCGTAACALGSAALHPTFNAAGLHTTAASYDPGYRRVLFQGHTNEFAGEQFFGITLDESQELFTRDTDSIWDPVQERMRKPRPRDVAKKVRALIAKYEEEMYGATGGTPEVCEAV